MLLLSHLFGLRIVTEIRIAGHSLFYAPPPHYSLGLPFIDLPRSHALGYPLMLVVQVSSCVNARSSTRFLGPSYNSPNNIIRSDDAETTIRKTCQCFKFLE